MKIAAVQSIQAVRPTDSGNTIVVAMVDGTGDSWTVLIPQAVARDLIPMLEAAGEEARELRQALGRE